MNLLTNSMERLTKILLQTDAKLKSYGVEPYGVRKMTIKEQRNFYDNLTEAQLYDLTQKHGMEAVNKWLYKMEQGG